MNAVKDFLSTNSWRPIAMPNMVSNSNHDALNGDGLVQTTKDHYLHCLEWIAVVISGKILSVNFRSIQFSLHRPFSGPPTKLPTRLYIRTWNSNWNLRVLFFLWNSILKTLAWINKPIDTRFNWNENEPVAKLSNRLVVIGQFALLHPVWSTRMRFIPWLGRMIRWEITSNISLKIK